MGSCVVIGGGLAGLVVARELARAGWEVRLLERSDHLGGKADAIDGGARGWIEHGYHVFPAWYVNVRSLAAELGVELIDFDRYHYLRPGAFPAFVTVRGPSSLGALLHNTFRGLLPWYHTALFGYSVIDMLSRPLSQKRLLDRISQVGLMRSSWYMTEAVAELNQENVLKASAIPAYDMSAMTAKKIAAFWVKRADPFLSVLAGDLGRAFIAPIARSTRDAGVIIETNVEVTRLAVGGGRVRAVETSAGERSADCFVVATPLEVSRGFIGDGVVELAPELGDIHHLEAEPMSALHVWLDHRLDGLPREHVFLHGGRYGLSFIDNSQIWTGGGSSANTYLSFISSNFSPLAAASDAVATRLLLDEIAGYLPIDPARVETRLNTNVAEPLFINTIGAWPNRPQTTSAIANLFFAGDWVQSSIDLACMEGAVASALDAAAAIEATRGGELPGSIEPPTHSRALFVALRWGMLPAILPTYLVARAAELLSR